ncbi:MAG: anti-sigma factor family protein [Candidatus Eiseniibacteriota bacterium]
MSHDLWTDRLSDYLDGAMSAEERSACGVHLDSCAECSRTLASLREVVAQAKALPARAPVIDLWPGIEARLGSAAAPAPRVLRFRLPRHVHLSLPQALAAGFALVALSGGLMWWALRHETAGPGGAARGGARDLSASQLNGAASGVDSGGPPATPALKRAAAPAPGGSEVAHYAAYEAHYDQAIAELENTLHEHRSELDTSTVRVVEQDLVIINHAIEQARRALEKDPASPYLHQHLALQMKLKLDLLRRTAAFAG